MLVAPMRLENGPTILVGHSYAGFVVTEAVNAPNVTGVVYVSSYTPIKASRTTIWSSAFPLPPVSPQFASTRTVSSGLPAIGFTRPSRTTWTFLKHTSWPSSKSWFRKRIALAYA